MELGKPTDDVNRNSTSGKTVRPKVEKQQSVTDEVVIVRKTMETWKERRASLDSQ
jgi:hypothetical protein